MRVFVNTVRMCVRDMRCAADLLQSGKRTQRVSC